MKRRPQPPPPRQRATAFDRIGFEVCEYANRLPCICKEKDERCCVAIELTVEKILCIIRGAGNAST